MLLVGCHEVDAPQDFVEGKEYAFDMNVMLSGMDDIQTRAFRDELTDYPPLWVVVFDDNGYLVEAAKATNFDREGNVTNFSVVLTATSQPRIVHLLLNYVDNSVEDLNLEPGHENNLIGSMVVSNNRDVYWQRVEVPGGINQASINTSLLKVPLLRNFLKITVENKCVDVFEFTGFYVMNVPNNGTVAPYMNGKFLEWKDSKTYDGIEELGYKGIMPDDVTYKNQDPSDPSWQTKPFYLYEKPFAANDKNNTLFILIKGKYKNGEKQDDTYYKADIIYKQDGINHYYDLIRNFVYKISIESVTGDGAENPKEAAYGAADNNMSSSVNLKDLLNISDGTSVLYVSYVDTTLTTTNSIFLKFKYVPNISTPSSVRNDLVDFTRKNTNLFSNIEFNNETVDSEGWSIAKLTPKFTTLPTVEISEALVLYVENLSREVTFRMRSKYDMELECNPKLVPEVPGSELMVNVKLPDGLNKALFPLDLYLTSVSKTNNDGSKLPYISPHTGTSISIELIDEVLYFVKNLDYDYYSNELTSVGGKRILPLKFVTNIGKSASTVSVSNKYFNDANDDFDNLRDFKVSFIDDATATYGVGRTVKLNIVAGEAGTYKVESTTLQAPTRAVLAELTLEADEERTIDLVTSKFADQGKVLVTCVETGVMKEIFAAERNTIKFGKLTFTGNKSPNDNSEITIKYTMGSKTTTVSPKPEYSKIKNGEYELLVSGITENDYNNNNIKFEFTYTRSNTTYKASSVTLATVMANTQLNFTQQK